MNAAPFRVALAQLAPVWLNKARTLEKVLEAMNEAARAGSQLVVFGEALLPGYPFWLGLTGGAAFDAPVQKALHAHYTQHAISIEAGDLDALQALARKHGLAVYLGIIERPADRGGHSLYASLVYIDPQGNIGSVHRKLQPTYDERLTWAPGDGHGLQVHALPPFTVGGLNCWENWMPLPRAALYGQGENLHVAVWPGSVHNTQDITRFIARESRSFVVSVSGLMRPEDFPEDTPHRAEIVASAPEWLADGGSCVAGPDGKWLLEPVKHREGVFTADLDINRVFEERQNFDPSGHYSRPDVT
ncbi:MAG: carbon-nitrogen hydrolase family protein, partial [Bacteroidota bacterium]